MEFSEKLNFKTPIQHLSEFIFWHVSIPPPGTSTKSHKSTVFSEPAPNTSASENPPAAPRSGLFLFPKCGGSYKARWDEIKRARDRYKYKELTNRVDVICHALLSTCARACASAGATWATGGAGGRPVRINACETAVLFVDEFRGRTGTNALASTQAPLRLPSRSSYRLPQLWGEAPSFSRHVNLFDAPEDGLLRYAHSGLCGCMEVHCGVGMAF